MELYEMVKRLNFIKLFKKGKKIVSIQKFVKN